MAQASNHALRSRPPAPAGRGGRSFHRRVKEVFDRAIALPLERRRAYIETACRGAEALRREVESLLAHHEEAKPGGDGDVASHPPGHGRGLFAGRYRLLRQLGEGGMGTVYEARDELLGVTVALKRLRAAAPVAGRRLLEEARLARLVTHPAVCRVYDVGRRGGECFLTMEPVNGEDLGTRIERDGAWPADRVVALGRTLCEALASAHAAGVVHRDLKPANILIDRTGAVRITDFGVAAIGSIGGRAALWGGSPAYMAPEQASPGGEVDERTDLYALGLVLYEALTASRPFQAATLRGLFKLHREAAPAAPTTLVADVPKDLEALVLEALAKDPADRPPSAAAMGSRLAMIAGAAAPPVTRAPLRRLPMPATSMVGRAGDIARIGDRLAAQALVTVVGPGGVGKTRLGLAVAESIVDRFWDGACFVDLTPLESGDDVAEAVARALAVPRRGGDDSPEAALLRLLAPRSILLVLDGCERIRAAVAALVERVVASGDQVRVLATSREALGVPGEALVPLEPLPVPPADVDPVSLLASEAAQLFVDRARHAAPGFALDAVTAAAVAGMVRRLDGLPLAIELAAAQVRRMPVAELAAKFAQGLALGTLADPVRPSRHRTLDGVVRWSYDLLDADERVLFGRLSIFAGSFDIEAAEAVASAPPLTRRRTIDVLSRLVDRSLVSIASVAGHRGYRLLDTLRAFAAARLTETREGPAVASRMLGHYVRVATAVRAERQDPVQRIKRLEVDLDNMYAALAFARTSRKRAAEGLKLAIALSFYWRRVGGAGTTRKRAEAILALAGSSAPPRLRVEALTFLGDDECAAGRYAEAQRYHLNALRLARRNGDRSCIAHSLRGLGIVEHDFGQLSRARAHLREAVAVARRLRDPSVLSSSLNAVATVCLDGGEIEEARSCFNGAIAAAKAGGKHPNSICALGNALGNLGILERREGNLRAARLLFRRTAAIHDRLMHAPGQVFAKLELAKVERAMGELTRARRLLEAALADARRVELGMAEVQALGALADIALESGDPAGAVTGYREALLRASEVGAAPDLIQLLEGAGPLVARADPALAARVDHCCATARERLGIVPTAGEAERRRRFLLDLERSLGARELHERFSGTGKDLEPRAAIEPVRAALAALLPAAGQDSVAR